jgi:hypothetical protein
LRQRSSRVFTCLSVVESIKKARFGGLHLLGIYPKRRSM